MPSLPSGTVTFVFTDIEDSTALLRKLGDGYGELLGEHRRIIREALGANGVEIDTQGDAFFFAFPRAREAVTGAVEVQRAHAANDWPHDASLRVRIGLHTGEPHVADEGYLGLDVVRAARICTVAQGGQILLSESTRALLGSALPDGVSVFPRGERHLKGIEEPERIYELAIEGVEIEEDVETESAEPVVPEPPASPSPPSTVGEQAIERRFDDLGKRLAAGIEEQVARKLEREFEKLDTSPGEDADVENLAARSASLEEKIIARVEAALSARGISDDA
jgi:class 3 adenylate cyclase